MNVGNRELTEDERRLVRWMLEHGNAEASAFVLQLELAEVTPYRRPCGCASMNFEIRGRGEAPPGVHILANFHFGDGDEQSGIIVFSSQGVLSGVEVCGYSGDAPRFLPQVEQLRPVS